MNLVELGRRQLDVFIVDALIAAGNHSAGFLNEAFSDHIQIFRAYGEGLDDAQVV